MHFFLSLMCYLIPSQNELVAWHVLRQPLQEGNISWGFPSRLFRARFLLLLMNSINHVLLLKIWHNLNRESIRCPIIKLLNTNNTSTVSPPNKPIANRSSRSDDLTEPSTTLLTCQSFFQEEHLFYAPFRMKKPDAVSLT